jgi:hypothetical protein
MEGARGDAEVAGGLLKAPEAFLQGRNKVGGRWRRRPPTA